MRLSEKTLELNICAQMSARLNPHQNLLWFGLTQKQEARAGFDACAKLRGRLLVFQFKASNHVLMSGKRRFLAPHHQFVALKAISGSSARSVFYAFPMIGNTLEVKKNPDLLQQTWLLDLAIAPSLSPPTTTSGSPRKNGCHNVYVSPGKVEIHSDPVQATLINASDLASSGFRGTEGLQSEVENYFDSFWEQSRTFSRGAKGLVLY